MVFDCKHRLFGCFVTVTYTSWRGQTGNTDDRCVIFTIPVLTSKHACMENQQCHGWTPSYICSLPVPNLWYKAMPYHHHRCIPLHRVQLQQGFLSPHLSMCVCWIIDDPLMIHCITAVERGPGMSNQLIFPGGTWSLESAQPFIGINKREHILWQCFSDWSL